MSLAFRNVVPADPAHIPAEKIVEFRKTHAEERGLFKAELAKFTSSLSYLHDVRTRMRHAQVNRCGGRDREVDDLAPNACVSLPAPCPGGSGTVQQRSTATAAYMTGFWRMSVDSWMCPDVG